MSDEWGPWVEHDGKGCPRGHFVEAAFKLWREKMCFIAGSDGGGSWIYGNIDDFRTWNGDPVVRYRIRKPKGMQILNEIVRNPERELEGA